MTLTASRSLLVAGVPGWAVLGAVERLHRLEEGEEQRPEDLLFQSHGERSETEPDVAAGAPGDIGAGAPGEQAWRRIQGELRHLAELDRLRRRPGRLERVV